MKIEQNQAVVNGKSIKISTKTSVSMCKFIKNRPLKQAESLIKDVISQKIALPIKRYTKNISHKKGNVATGSYPVNLSNAFLGLLNSVKKNAEIKGLNTDSLFITFAKADKAEARYRFGRKGRTKMKATHVSIIVTEKEQTKKEKK